MNRRPQGSRRIWLTGLLLLGGAGPLLGRAGAAPLALSAPAEVTPGGFLSLPLPAGGFPAGAYAVSATLPEGWTLLSDTLELGAGASGLLNVYVPEGALAGRQALAFRLSREGAAPVEVEAQVVVPTRTAFSVELPEGARVRPGERRTFTARVTNAGNAADTFVLKVEGSATVSPARLSLKPGETGTAELRYAHSNQGTADSLTLIAESTTTPGARQDDLLPLSVGYAAAGSGPQLTWQVSVSPTVEHVRPAAPTAPPPAGDAGPDAPDLPGLPGTGPEDRADEVQGPPSGLAWGGAVTASIGGALSDYATGSVAYTVTRMAGGELRDSGQALVRWGQTGVTLGTRGGANEISVGASHTRGAYTFGVTGSRSAGQGGEAAVYTVGAGVTHTSGVTVSAAQSFGGADTTAFGVAWSRQLGAYAPGVGLYAVHAGGRWGVVGTQSLNFENRALLARQSYSYDSLQNAHRLDLRVASRSVRPFGYSATGQLGVLNGALRYTVGGALTYTPDPSLSATLGASYGSDGFGVRLNAAKEWQLGQTRLYLDTEAEYRAGVLGGGLEATAAIPAGGGQVLVRGLVGYAQGAVVYGAGVGYANESVRVAAGAQAGGGGYALSASAAFTPRTGFQAGIDLGLTRTGTGSAATVRGSAGYASGRWNAALTGGYVRGETETGVTSGLLYGASVGVRLTETLGVTARAETGGGGTRVALNASFTPGGAVQTPAALVNLFGGLNAGTAEVLAFLDTNRNGAQDAGEGPATTTLHLAGTGAGAGCDIATDAAGRGSAQVRPGEYTLELGSGVEAHFLLPELPKVKVPLKGRVQVLVPVQQAGILQGQLRDDTGQLLSGVPIAVTGPDGEKVTTTDAEGRYRLTGLNFGSYTVAARPDAQHFAAPEPTRLELGARSALITTDLTARAIIDSRGLDTSGLSVTLTLPDTPLPPGVAVPVSVRVTPVADRVTLDDPGGTALTRVDGSDEWRGTAQVPADQKVPLEVQVTAWRGEAGTSERGLLLVDPSKKAAELGLRPLHALPEQVMELRATVYGSPGRVSVRLADGKTLLLTADGAHGHVGQLRAAAAPGRHTVVLLVDGQAVAEASYVVLGRP